MQVKESQKPTSLKRLATKALRPKRRVWTIESIDGRFPGELIPKQTYVNRKTPLWWRCKDDHPDYPMMLDQRLKEQGCPPCGRISTNAALAERKWTVEEIDGRFPGELIPNQTYVNVISPLWWRCKDDHPDYPMSLNKRLKEQGCPPCGRISTNAERRWTMQEIAERFPGELLPNQTYTNNKTKLWWNCKAGHHDYSMSLNNRLMEHGCPHCRRSKGEKAIVKWLEGKYEYIVQYPLSFGRNSMKFDFCVPTLKLMIEFHGVQHYKEGPTKWGTLAKRQEYDCLKAEWAKVNGWALLTIHYTKLKQIDALLKQEIGAVVHAKTKAIRRNSGLFAKNPLSAVVYGDNWHAGFTRLAEWVA